MAIITGILTHEPYWYECDTCGYVSKQTRFLSAVVRMMNKHRKETHPERVASVKMPPKAPWKG